MLNLLLAVLSLNLQQAEDFALQHNKAILVAEQEEEQYKYRKLQALSAYLPKITYGFLWAKLQKPLRADPLSHFRNLYNNQFQLDQPIFSADTIYGLRAAKYYWEGTKADKAIATNGVLYQTRTLYYAVVLTQQSVEVQEEVIHYLQSAVNDEEKKFDAGRSTSFEINQCKTALSSAKATYHSYLKDLRSSKNALIFDLGADPREELVITETTFPIEHYPLLVEKTELAKKASSLFSQEEIGMWIGMARRSRPELQKTQALVKATSEEVKAKRGKYLPTISGFIDYGYFLPENGLPFKQQNNFMGGIQLNWTIFDSFKREFHIQEMKFVNRAANFGYLQEMDRMEADICTTVVQMEEAIFSTIAADEAYALAKQAMEDGKIRLSSGTITPLQFKDAAKSYAEARLQSDKARYNLLQLYFLLQFHIGQS